MTRRNLLLWALIAVGAGAVGVWVAYGRSFVRQRFYAVAPLDGASRTDSRFLALLLPRITLKPHRYAMSTAELAELLGALKGAGYVPLSLSDVAGLYGARRRLPPKGVLVAFSQDDPQGLEAADGVLRALRWRGVAFITRTALKGGGDERRFLTEHAVAQMRAGGAWEFARAEGGLLRSEDGALRFTASEVGLNDGGDDPRALNALALRPDRGSAENAAIVKNSWPRTAPFIEDFGTDGPRSDWVAGWGVVAMRGRRLVLLPTPKQTGAGVFIRGTERWRDLTLEFELERFRKEFWAYARYRDDDSYVRVGARDGHWYVEQKTAQGGMTQLLGRAPIHEDAWPATVRLVLKGGAAIVHVNGRMQFGRALRVHRDIGRGSVLLGVYDARTPAALAVLTGVRAAPLGEDWLAPSDAPSEPFGEEHLEALREEAVRARAVSPAWVSVGADGSVSVAETQGLFIRSLAGFYGCRLVPSVDFARLQPGALAAPASADKLVADLAEAARALDVGGLNLRMALAEEPPPETIDFLKKLRAAFHLRRRRLAVTVDGSVGSDGPLARAVDELLRPSKRSRPGLELLSAAMP